MNRTQQISRSKSVATTHAEAVREVVGQGTKRVARAGETAWHGAKVAAAYGSTFVVALFRGSK